MTPLEARQANNKAILLAIQKREESTTATIRRLTYAQAVQQRRAPHQPHTPTLSPTHTTNSNTQAAANPPPPTTPTPNHCINGVLHTSPQPIPQNPQADNKTLTEEGWTLVTRKKSRIPHQNTTRPIKISIKQDHAWLLQQRRCFKCFLKGHQKHRCNRAIKCLQCNQEGHISKHCSNRINRRIPTAGETNNYQPPLENGEKSRQTTPLFTGMKQGSPNFLKQTRANLLQQGRCFQCCLRGHTKQQCTRVVKCFLCNKDGHMAIRCKLNHINAKPPNGNTNPIKANDVQPQPTQPGHRVDNFATNHLKHMENSPTWEFMDLMDPDDFEDGRRESLRVFLPPKTPLRPINSFLERSALVLAGPHPTNRYIAHRLAVTLATHFNMQPRDFPISRVHQNYGDFLVRFPNTHLRDQAVAICVFTLGPNMHLQLVEWTPGMGGVYDPVTHKARLRLYGLLNHNWNIHDLDILVSGFGHLLRVEPFSSTGNHQEIRILVGCYHPINIPRTIDLSEEPHTCIVHVVIEGWMHDGTAAIPRDVTNFNDDEDPFGGPINVRRRQHHMAERNQQRRETTTGSNSPGPADHGRNGNRQVQQSSLLERSLEIATVQHTGGIGLMGEIELAEQKASGIFPYVDLMFCLLFKGMELYEKSKRSAGNKCNGQRLTCAHLFGEKNFIAEINTTSITHPEGPQQEGFSDFATYHVEPIAAQKDSRNGPTIVEISQAQLSQPESREATGPQSGSQGQEFRAISRPTEISALGLQGLQIQQEDMTPLDPPPGFEGRQTQEHNGLEVTPHTLQDQQPSQEDTTDLGPPPGFEGRTTFTAQNRRSTRLLEKHAGKYTSILQRAQEIKGSTHNGGNAKSDRKKPRIGSQLQISYLQGSGPLTAYQAEAVLAQAGIVLDDATLETIKGMIVIPPNDEQVGVAGA
ncbi:Cellular nucleic acid-binding protein [Carex littledalei]|uniref:Cellular nucleic acid-binding protein n=1 Tax=Carex littledalei TaxID=544730 RepID=A0A833QLI1_9POAL|nr:Cellular nucleic acid-binding protein [Carex littledalei]